MSATNIKQLKRDCQATMIPSGDVINLPIGTQVIITHRLGGNFTVSCDYGMFRIAGKDADALDEPIPTEESVIAAQKKSDHKGPPDEQLLWEQVKSVYDPEIPVNIVDLGLVYSLEIYPMEGDKYGVRMSMTLTAPGCGMGPSIAADARERLMGVPGVSEAIVELVWDPAWNQDMISEDGKMQLGLI